MLRHPEGPTPHILVHEGFNVLDSSLNFVLFRLPLRHAAEVRKLSREVFLPPQLKLGEFILSWRAGFRSAYTTALLRITCVIVSTITLLWHVTSLQSEEDYPQLELDFVTCKMNLESVFTVG